MTSVLLVSLLKMVAVVFSSRGEKIPALLLVRPVMSKSGHNRPLA